MINITATTANFQGINMNVSMYFGNSFLFESTRLKSEENFHAFSEKIHP